MLINHPLFWVGLAGEAAAVPAPRGGDDVPDYPGRARGEPDAARKARKTAEERKAQTLRDLDETLEKVWQRLHGETKPEVTEPEAKPAKAKAKSPAQFTAPRPPIDYEAAARDTALYRETVATLKRAIREAEALIRAREDEDDIEVMMMLL